MTHRKTIRRLVLRNSLFQTLRNLVFLEFIRGLDQKYLMVNRRLIVNYTDQKIYE